uniref:Uncharacterized protein n=1 Tax=Arundo donax TaxID=35708 RepID=A0A0A9H5H4_ARUDO
MARISLNHQFLTYHINGHKHSLRARRG